MKICQRCNSRYNLSQKMASKEYNSLLGEVIINNNKCIDFLFLKKNLDIDLKYFTQLTKTEFLELSKIM